MAHALAVEPSLDFVAIRHAVARELDLFLDAKASDATGPELLPVIELLREFLATGGKRLRPLLCYCGWYAASASAESEALENQHTLHKIAASLELFHAFTLIHDDIMDASERRRGRPTIHRAMTARCRQPRSLMEAERFGINSAILIGDLVLVWSDELVHGSGLDPRQLGAVQPLLAAMRTEVMHGQYLDLLATSHSASDLEAAMTVVRYKTAKYTVERPLHVGAALAGADQHRHPR